MSFSESFYCRFPKKILVDVVYFHLNFGQEFLVDLCTLSVTETCAKHPLRDMIIK